jgi:FkbM family methyltransferase
MKKWFSKARKKFKLRCGLFYYRYWKHDLFLYWHRRWLLAEGDNTLRLDYPLDRESVVMDVGGFKGDFCAAITSKFNCRVFVFEPVPKFYNICAARFASDDRVTCLNFGLCDIDGSFSILNDGDASSLCRDETLGLASDSVVVRRFDKVFSELCVNRIDLIKINIEGGEFSLLDHMISSGLISYVEHLQVQFHNFVPNAENLRMGLRRLLSETHEEVWCFPFIWESWRRRSF